MKFCNKLFINFRHGLGRTDYYLLNDPDLSFQEVLRKKVNSEQQPAQPAATDNKEAIKIESHEDILKFDKDEILVKLEKGEGTLKIEKVAVKKDQQPDEKKLDTVEIENKTTPPSVVKPEEEVTEKAQEESREEEKPVETEKEDTPKEEVKEQIDGPIEKEINEEKLEEKTEVEEKPAEEVKEEVKEVITETNEPEEEVKKEVEEKTEEKLTVEEIKPESIEKDKEPQVEKEKEKTKETEETVTEVKVKKPVEVKKEQQEKEKEKPTESDLCSKQAAELKAMFPDLEVIQPLSRLSQVDTFVLRDKQGTGALDFSETTVAQLFNNAVKWPKEYAIQVRLQHIIFAVETKEWPVTKSFSAYATGIGNEIDIPLHELPNDPQPVKRDSSTPMSLGGTSGDSDIMISGISSVMDRSLLNKKRTKRHIAIDVETERAKLHALLNSSHMSSNPLSSSKHALSSWADNDDSEDSRRSTPVQTNLQPPPAHQQTSSRATMLNMPYDIKYHPAMAKTIGQTTVIPGTSSTLTPIDLSSR